MNKASILFIMVFMPGLIKTLRVFFSFISKDKKQYSLFIFLTIIYSGLSAIIPYFYKLFVDNFSIAEFGFLIRMLMLLLVIRFASLFLEVAAYYIGDKLVFSTVMNSKIMVFRHLQDLDFAFHTDKSTGKLISYIKRGEGALWSLYHSIHHRIINVVVGFIVMTIFFASISWYAAFVVAASFIIAVLLTIKLVKLNIKARRAHNIEQDNLAGIVVDNLVNFETVKLFSKEEWELKRLKKAYVPWLSTAWDYVNTFRVIDISIGSVINISIFVILILGLNLSGNNSRTAGDFILMFGFVNSFYPKLYELVFSFRDIGKNYTDVEKFFDLLENDIEIKDPQDPIFLNRVRGEITYKDVSFSYKDGKQDAIKNLDLDIRQGQSVALVGKSGSGKTTLVKLLMRFYDPESGTITLDDNDIKRLTKSHLRSFIGVVPQEPILFNNTLEYNIGYGKENVSKKEITAAAKMANLHEFIEQLPKGYQTNVGERGIKLSGGQKQRVAIARMMLSDPDIIIFDEATSQLDSENEKMIQDAFWKVAQNKTTIIIAHRLSTALRADKIVVMDDGQIVDQGTHNDLVSKEQGIYKYLWSLQTLEDNQSQTA